MFKRLFAFLFGARRGSKAGPEPDFYPIVGATTVEGDADATAPWRGPAQASAATDRTVLALPPDHPAASSHPAGQPAGDMAEARQRLSWPARDLSRSRPVPAPPPDDATVIVSRDRSRKPPAPPAGAPDDKDTTILVTGRAKPRPPNA